MPRTEMLPAAERFVADMRQVFEAGVPEPARWERCRALLKTLLADPGMAEHARDWPVTGFNPETNRVGNLLFYEDPDYGFVINALIKKPGGRAMVHDHGPSWTIYGLLSGTERIVWYDATARPDGKYDIAESRATDCGPGDVDIVPPGEIHSEYAGPEKSIAVIVRSQRSGTFEQFRYLDDGTQTVISGPEQIPYDLS